ISENEKSGQLLCYSSEKYLLGIPTLNDIVAENNEGLIAILDSTLSSC
ncbi:2640_t:CDS:1, partial [Acaulospora morrowiae]